MDRDQIIHIISTHREELKRKGVRKLSLFGSFVRGEGEPGSDIDLLVEFEEPVGLFDFFRLQHYLEEILGVERVDLVQPGALHPALKERILAEAEHVA